MLAIGIAGATPALAQISATLYGIVDTGIGYQSSQTTLGRTSGGYAAVSMVQAVWAGNRFGFKGAEDVGGGTKALFQLEAGFNSSTGSQQFSGLMFGRQAWAALTNSAWGTLSAGRQYASYFQMLLPVSPITWLSAFYGAHPGDIEALSQ